MSVIRVIQNLCSAVGFGLLGMACGSAPSSSASPDDAPPDVVETPTPDDAGLAMPRTHDAGCVAPSSVSSAPGTIAQTLELVNALPKPLTLPCFLEALARPLQVQATNSLFSAQPAQGARSPRIFVFTGAVTMSVVPAGTGAALLEFGETRAGYRSLKAELDFPVLAPLPMSAPYEGFMFNERVTTCGVCHAAETEEATASGVRTFVSQALRPARGDRVPLASLQRELAVCDRNAEPARCAMLDGVFGWGDVTEHDFPTEMSTLAGD